ncbi:DNA polymeras-like protein alpha/primase associated subunit [Amylocarpus encephaloides]|uniref:DNA polymerase alpha subunit B n=1 Tax=Amylocarpus encephaloides TaxID=45428 RepID=A0A9P8C4E1_9HELO|nr:DNA polymeras-like protein alpha/primase associated subunit [Amylocarpus encephaloides]
MAESTVDELHERFGAVAGGTLEADVLAELQSIMRLHSIDAEELWYKWESYSMKMGVDEMKLNAETANALKKDVQEGLERENRSKGHLQTNKRGAATPRNTAGNGDMLGILGNAVPNTPRVGSASRSSNKRKFETPSIFRVKADPASSPPDFKTPLRPSEPTGATVPFNDRANAGQTVEVLNDYLLVPEPPIAPYSQPRVKSVANSDYKALAYKTMAMKSSEASEILDDRIIEFMTLVQSHHNLEDDAFGSAAAQSTNEIVAVGRIACDSLEGKLNSSSLVLETSRRIGGGLRVLLKVDKLKGFQFFPGQIVALKGINISGEDFTASEVLEMPLLRGAASAPAKFEEYSQRLRGGPDAMDSDSDPAPLSIIIGSGPYTADDNLDFEPLHALCSRAADTYADALVLTGPFLDVDHPLIAVGDFDLPEEALAEPDTISMTTVFKYLISPAFISLCTANPHTVIILVPSVKDVICNHVSWPQERFPRKDLGLPKNVMIVGNPMTLSLNEISLGISSQDIMTELRKAEVTGGQPKDTSLLARLPRYLIEQRHFFPLFPPVDREALPKTGTLDTRPVGAMIDASYLKLGEMVNVRPDVLIVPSALGFFAKVVESVVVINPGFLSKRKAAGTYAKLTVYPAKLSEEETNSTQMIGHRLHERARVDIIKI